VLNVISIVANAKIFPFLFLPSRRANKRRTPRVFAWCQYLHGAHSFIPFDPFCLAASARRSFAFPFTFPQFSPFRLHFHLNCTLALALFLRRVDRIWCGTLSEADFNFPAALFPAFNELANTFN